MNNDRKMELSRAILSAAYIAAGIILMAGAVFFVVRRKRA